MARYDSVLELIGKTPLVDISAVQPQPRRPHPVIKLEGQNPGGSVKDRVALSMIETAESDGILKPGQPADPHRAVVGQHRHRPGHGLQGQGLPAEGGACRPTCRSSGASCSSCGGPRSSSRPGPRGPTVPCAGPSSWPTSTPSGPSSTSTATRPTPRPTTRARDPRSGGTAPRSPTSWRAWAPRAPCSAWAATCRSEPRHPGLGRRAAGRGAGGRAAQPRRRLHPAHLRGHGRGRAARPQDHRAAPGVDRVDPAADRGGRSSPASRTGAAVAGAIKCASSLQPGEAAVDRGGLRRRRLEVPVHRGLDRRPRRGPERAKSIIYF